MRLACPHGHALRALQRQLIRNRNGPTRLLHTPTKLYDAAVIGGGVTGLTTAFRLAQDPSCSKVTLYERSNRLGGWIQSETVEVDDGEVVFEYGPRTLRTAVPQSLPLIDLLFELGLEDQILLTSKNAPAARNRYIYYPDHLVRMPAPYPNTSHLANIFWNGWTLLTEPVFDGFIRAVLREPTKDPREDKVADQDESVAEFVSRRTTPQVADNLVSALYHGIYAGDIDRLSAQTLMGPYRDLEKTENRVIGSLLNIGGTEKMILMTDDLLAIHSVEHDRPRDHWKVLHKFVKGTSVLTLKKGIGQLAERLESAIRDTGKVEIMTGTEVNSISRDRETSDLTVRFGEGNSRTHNRIIATSPAPQLAKMLRSGAQGNQQLPIRTIRPLEEHNYAVTVMVVNLYYDRPNLIPYEGFGYLIPRSIPYDQNPERALGVIFGSDSSVGQDTAPGTKLTVMMGGHWWDGWEESDYPDHDSAVSMARSLLERHLSVKDAPVIARSRLQRNAIPQYTVGHTSRMQELSRAVREEFNHRLTLAGSWYGGVGVTDCVRQAYLAASYGVNARRLDDEGEKRPWSDLPYRDWDLEGGLVTAPKKWSVRPVADMRYITGRTTLAYKTGDVEEEK
ncbi:hypothetical protein VTN00DRAFT_4760 [Thermoascus crustaceus]|uniref:uncharacterized protein n=1 Tax=Thermoascus crustaceus TaxID=5088 RepID=UPI0037432783